MNEGGISDAVNLRPMSAGGAILGEPFSIGRALSAAWSVFREGFWKFFVLMLITHLPMLLLIGLVAGVFYVGTTAGIVGAALGVISYFTLVSIATITYLFGAYQIMRQRSFGVGEAMSVAFSRLFPVLGATFLATLLVFVFLLLLVVPGVIVACMLGVALPACVLERLGPITSLSRSRSLTEGYRWQIFGLQLIVGIIGIVSNYGLHFFSSVVVGLIAGPTAGAVAGALAGYGVALMVSAFGSVVWVVVYRDLRAGKEGVDVEHLASVFD